MLLYDLPSQKRLPTAEELPHTDDTPVESDLQSKIANLLRDVLYLIWGSRNDWFFGIDIGLYYDPDAPAIAPDGFLSLGVEGDKGGENLRPSYAIWEENGVIPILAIEVVSKTPGSEYKRKKKEYANIGIKYYVIYAPLRRRKPRFTIYKLEKGQYRPLQENPVWLPEVGLAIGTGMGTYQRTTREWLYWYDEGGSRYPTQEEARLRAEQAQLRAEQAQLAAQQTAAEERAMRLAAEEQATQLAARLIELGIDPDNLG